MVVILPSSPLQPQSDAKIISDKKATLMKDGEGWLFFGRFNIGKVSEMRNKDVLALYCVC